MRRLPVIAAALAIFASHAAAVDPSCTTAIASAPFASTTELRRWHELVGELGVRATAAPSHRRYLRWLRRQLRDVPGITINVDRFPIAPRQLERGAHLAIVGTDGVRRPIRVAGPVPYTQLTRSRGVTAPMLYLPNGQEITTAVAAGHIVVRERAIVGLPYRTLQSVAHLWYDPRATLDPDAPYERENLSRQTLEDLRAARDAGAAGLVMIEPFPREQIAGQYQPYRGEVFAVPAVVLGADEGSALLDTLRAGPARGTIAVRGSQGSATTWNLIGTLAGSGPEKIVVASHTDGVNPIWDNGPLAMLALARHFASLPLACRPKALEFAFTSAHLYLSQHGADRYAAGLDCPSVSLVVVLEHLGATEFDAVPRTDTGPGRVLVPTGAPELTFVFATPTASLLEAMRARIVGHDLERMAIVPFTAGIANGEGRSYDPLGFPTLAAIAGPWTLRNPAFGMETVDVEAMRNMTLAFRDVIVDLQDAPRAATSGGRACVAPAS
jgi:hypothetical protein